MPETLSPKTMNNVFRGLIALFVIVVILTITLAVLASMGLLAVKIPNGGGNNNGPPITDVRVGEVASFSPTIQNKTWTKVFDSNNGCIIDLSDNIPVNTFKKLYTYIIKEDLKPIDNPFEGCIDVPVIDCSDGGSEGGEFLVLTLDLSKYGGVNPFKLNDQVYIYDVGGVSNANSTNDVNYFYTKELLVANTYTELPNIVGRDQIMIGMWNENRTIIEALTTEGMYSGGGVVRLLYRPYEYFNVAETMFYVYMSCMGTPFYWPRMPKTPSEAYAVYSSNFKKYTKWLAGLSPTCTTTFYEPRKNGPAFTNGALQVTGGTGGKGTGMKIDYIDLKFYSGNFSFYLVTADGVGYENDTKVTVKQNDLTHDINVNTNCNGGASHLFFYSPLSIPLSTSPAQLKSLINEALWLESTINTISIETSTAKNTYAKPNFVIKFNVTSPTSDPSSKGGIMYNHGLYPLCTTDPNGPVAKCIKQTIYTTTGEGPNQTPFDFIAKSSLIIDTCVPVLDKFEIP